MNPRIFMSIAATAATLAVGGCHESPTEDRSEQKAAAYEQALAAVKREVPGTREFSPLADVTYERDGLGRDKVTGWVDVANEAGGVVRRRFEAVDRTVRLSPWP